ncbi:MAG: DNA-directed RNA polymerase subunit omega [Acidimicrobiia bacterium]|nr:DNA-directed RNA polymerase subunit omega [Acidimicrobiia bacterium]MYC57356.1 DNA-directed RNA polymerase subunit omega [Acidimicrobiia bacterium]MYG94559.1 DNA-directed RNA polymerase subunit omega [Acidimicrobiia bacterium]MYI31158.1 DNA-directed RNA polymerase subunit omega [Acidimicrobiia bacterium]
MMSPQIEELLGRTESKFRLVTLSAKRACQINSYFGQLGEGLGSMVPPQILTVSRKPLTIAFEEIAADKIIATESSAEVLEEMTAGEHWIPSGEAASDVVVSGDGSVSDAEVDLDPAS